MEAKKAPCFCEKQGAKYAVYHANGYNVEPLNFIVIL